MRSSRDLSLKAALPPRFTMGPRFLYPLRILAFDGRGNRLPGRYLIAASRAFLGGMIALSMAAFGAGLVMWAHALMNDQQVIEEREILPSLPREREEAAKALFAEHEVRRRKMLLAMSFGIVGAFAAAVLSLFRSFEESPEPVLSLTFRFGGAATAW